jgi:hypothetical protein
MNDLEQEKSKSKSTLVAMVVLIAAAIAGNSLGAFLVYKYGSQNIEWLISLSIGLLVAQPGIIAVWAALSDQQLIHRLSLATATLFAMSAAYIGTLNALDRGLPMDVGLILLSIPAILFGSTASAMGFLRRQKGIVLTKSLTEHTHEDQSRQFSIKFLLVATTVIAVLIPVVKWAIPSGGFEGNAPWMEVGTFIVLFAVLSWAIFLTSLILVFHSNHRVFSVVTLLLLTTIGPILVIGFLALNFVSFRRDIIGMMVNAFFYCVGVITCTAFVLLIFRGLGFRICCATDDR